MSRLRAVKLQLCALSSSCLPRELPAPALRTGVCCWPGAAPAQAGNAQTRGEQSPRRPLPMLRVQHSPLAGSSSSSSSSASASSQLGSRRAHSQAPAPLPRHSQLPSLRVLASASLSKPMSSATNGASVGGGTANGAAANGASTSRAAQSHHASSVVDFLELLHNLKTSKRAGWVKRGVRGPESISDHMHRMSLMALVTMDTPGIDKNRCIKIAAVHDVAEAIVGDITPSCGIPKEEKRRMETAAMDEMCAMLGPLGNEMRELWQEYEDAQTDEAKLVKDFDKVEMILQAMEYEKEQGLDLEEFFTSTAGKFQTDIGKSYAAEICARRLRMLENKAALPSSHPEN